MKLCYPCFGCVVKMMITCVCKSMSDCGGLFITTGGVNTGSSPKILVHVKILVTHFLLFHFSKNKTHRTIVGNSLFCILAALLLFAMLYIYHGSTYYDLLSQVLL